jgi:hypothetical protein
MEARSGPKQLSRAVDNVDALFPLTMNPNVGQCVWPATPLAAGRSSGAGETHCPTLALAPFRGSRREMFRRILTPAHSLRERAHCAQRIREPRAFIVLQHWKRFPLSLRVRGKSASTSARALEALSAPRHSSHVTRHSLVTRHSSHITRHSSSWLSPPPLVRSTPTAGTPLQTPHKRFCHRR